MPAGSREEAVDDLVGRWQDALSCVIRVTVISSKPVGNRPLSLTLFAHGQDGGDAVQLHTHAGYGQLRFASAFTFRAVQRSKTVYGIETSFYHYDILDRDGNEIVVFHWAPDGASPVRTPHAHVPAAAPITLPQRGGSPLAGAKTHLGNLHLPKGEIGIEAVVELLIRDFAVDPLRADWAKALVAERGSGERG